MYYDNLADKTEIIHLKKRQDSNDDSRDNSYFPNKRQAFRNVAHPTHPNPISLL